MRTVATVAKMTETTEDECQSLGFWAKARLTIKESSVPGYETRRMTCYRLFISAGRWSEDVVEYVAYEESLTREAALMRHAAILSAFEAEERHPIIDPMLRGSVGSVTEWMGLFFARLA